MALEALHQSQEHKPISREESERLIATTEQTTEQTLDLRRSGHE